MNNELSLKKNPTLQDFQTYIEQMVKARGFENETVPETLMLFLEECGEMAKAARKTQNVKSDQKSKEYHIDQEIADVFIYLLVLCNKFDVDLEEAFRIKEDINKKRSWQ